ncbi:MAG: hypothetical protein K8R08_07975 [Methanosarcinales archaeon]|nr:hypothetical protein [Methanosarcinales archaeon]
MKLKTVIISLVALTAVMALTIGCIDSGKANGGGMFIDQNEHKVTFGFNAQGDGCDTFKGQFQLVDHETGQKIHVSEMYRVDVDNDEAKFKGFTKDGVQVIVYVTDHGEPGPDAGDYIAVYYDISPQCEPPTWDGNLVKGNIQIHKDK